MKRNVNQIGRVKLFSFSIMLLLILSLFGLAVFAVDSSSNESLSTPIYFFDNFAMYMIIIFGIFSFVAYLVVTYIVYKGQGFFGPWIFFSIIALLFLFSEFTLNNIVLHRRFVAGIMFLFFTAAVFRYWDAVEKGQ